MDKTEQINKLALLSGVIIMVTLTAFGLKLFQSPIPQNLTTWVMWAILNALLLRASISAGNKQSWMLSAGATLGVVFITLILLSNGEWHWGMVETISVIGATVTTVIWKSLGPKRGVIAIVVAMNVAGLPNMYDTYLAPNPEGWWLWAGLALACLLAGIGAEKWTVQDRLFPVVNFFFNLTMLILVFL
ncbi:MAG: hypothetical protein Q7K26_06775 [bacterium]|nr:hypothetical protein [bacterium]